MVAKKNLFLRGFTLIELAFVLIIVGVLAGAVMKGRDLLDGAKAKAVVADLNRIRMTFSMYQESHGALPGDDMKANDRFGGDVQNGDGDGTIANADILKVWSHLSKSSGGADPDTAPTSKWGGKYFIVTNPTNKHQGHWIVLSDSQDGRTLNGLLSPQQAILVKSKASDGTKDPLKGDLQILEGTNFREGDCVNDKGGINANRSDKTCIILMRLD